MKIIAIILLLITAAGTFIPCCQDDCLTEQTNPVDHKTDCTDVCSPFFGCLNCPGSVELNETNFVSEISDQPLSHQTGLRSFRLTLFSNSFWQPPRIC